MVGRETISTPPPAAREDPPPSRTHRSSIRTSIGTPIRAPIRASIRSALRRPLSPGMVLLLVLLATDVVFVAATLTRLLVVTDLGQEWNITRDRSHPEAAQWIKTAGAAVMVVMLGRRRRDVLLGAWSLVFVYLVADDALLVHERVGAWLADRLVLEARFGLRAQDFGEQIVVAAAAVLLGVVLLAALCRTSAAGRACSRRLVELVLALAFFGVLVDQLHSLASGHLRFMLAIVDDGGEMVVMSVVVAAVWSWLCVPHRTATLGPHAVPLRWS